MLENIITQLKNKFSSIHDLIISLWVIFIIFSIFIALNQSYAFILICEANIYLFFLVIAVKSINQYIRIYMLRLEMFIEIKM